MSIICMRPCTKLWARNRLLRGSLDLEKFIMKIRQGRETLVLMILFRVACETVIFFTYKKSKITGEKSQSATEMDINNNLLE